MIHDDLVMNQVMTELKIPTNTDEGYD